MKPRIPARRYRELEAAARRDVYAFVDALATEWDQYRRGSITELVGRIYGEVKAQNPDLVVSAAVFPDWRSAARWQLQEWAVWLAEGVLDIEWARALGVSGIPRHRANGSCTVGYVAWRTRRNGMSTRRATVHTHFRHSAYLASGGAASY